ncbi:MAG TPA: GTPase HflX, partial [Candidatus Goldiibacteriota bacterium]|nr:GTPase HflX [Candidatus Goldiibacteriota bacterium]
MEKALIVKVYNRENESELASAVDEMKGLIMTAGGEVAGVVMQKKSFISPAFYIGRGKAIEIAGEYGGKIDLAVFDTELKPVQVKNLEDTIGIRVIDRTQLILDIFSRRAHTSEGKLQVEHAQLSYLLPRLTGRGADLMQQTGGIGTRGPGETKLEVDRRRIKQRLQRIKDELEAVRAGRLRQRERRKSVPVPLVAIVGYTNAGKTMLLNRLTGAGMLSEDMLFATLDPKIKRFRLPSGYSVLFSDTVGFIRDLPTHLVAAFRATL